MNNMQFQENIKAIESLIDKGIYNPNFKQPKWAKEFFAESIKKIMTPTMKTILECGVGTGFWIKLLQALYPGHVFYGFDISDKMLQIAKVNLGFSKNILLKKGDILQDESFHFNNISSFDMIFCYDVIQQISNKNYISVIRNMLRHINKNGVVIIFVKEDITDLDQASIIFHEMFHFLGEQIIAANEKSAAYGRQGYEIFGVNSPYKSWLLEGGLVTFESARFGEELATDTFYKKDSEIRTQMIEHAMQSGDIVEGRLKFDSGMEVEPRYLWIMPEYQGIKDRKAFGLPENSGLAGSFFELISSRFQGEEKDNFLNIVYAARRDLKLIPKLAGLIDDKFSRGTYARMLKCERTEEAVWNFIQDLRGRTNSNSYRVT